MTADLNKKLINYNFSNASANYDQHAQVQLIAADKLCDLALPNIIEEAKNNEIKILDLGSGTSFITKILLKKLPEEIAKNITFFDLDISQEMLNSWSERPKNSHKIHADFDNLSMLQDEYDFILSSFSLQWSNDLNSLFLNLKNLLKANSEIFFLIPTNNSLKEIKEASIQSSCHFDFIEMPTIDSLISGLKKSGMSISYSQVEILPQHFRSGTEAIHFIKKIGASYRENSNGKNITKNKLQNFEAICDSFRINYEVNSSWETLTVKVQS